MDMSGSSGNGSMPMLGMGMYPQYNDAWEGNGFIFPGWTLTNGYLYGGTLIAVFLFACCYEVLSSFVADCHKRFLLANALQSRYQQLISMRWKSKSSSSGDVADDLTKPLLFPSSSCCGGGEQTSAVLPASKQPSAGAEGSDSNNLRKRQPFSSATSLSDAKGQMIYNSNCGQLCSGSCVCLSMGQRCYCAVLHAMKYFFSFILMVTFMTLDVGFTMALLAGLAFGYLCFADLSITGSSSNGITLNDTYNDSNATASSTPTSRGPAYRTVSHYIRRWTALREKYLAPLYRRLPYFSSFTYGEALLLFLWIGTNLSVAIPQFIMLTADNGDCDLADAAAGNCTLYNTVMLGVDYLGLLTAANALVMLVPASRNSVLLPVLGVSFEKSVKYHRFLGWFMFTVASVHMISAMWWYTQIDALYMLWVLNAVAPPDNASLQAQAIYSATVIDHTLAAFIAYISLLVALVTSIGPVRRLAYQAFHYTHILMYILFVTFACIHMPHFVTWFLLPVALLWAIDWMLRLRSGLAPAVCVSLKTIGRDVIELKFVKHEFHYTPSQYVFISIGELSVWDTHPFTIASAPHEPYVTCYIHRNGRWTDKLYKLAQDVERDGAKGKRMPSLYVEGPYGGSHAFNEMTSVYKQVTDADLQTDELLRADTTGSSSKGCQSVLLVAGGSGITVVRAMLHSLVKKHEQQRLSNVWSKNPIKQIHLVWVTRRYDALSLLHQAVQEEEEADRGGEADPFSRSKASNRSGEENDGKNFFDKSGATYAQAEKPADGEGYRMDIATGDKAPSLSIKVTIHVTGLNALPNPADDAEVASASAAALIKESIQQLQREYTSYEIECHTDGRPQWDRLLASYLSDGESSKRLVQVCGPVGMKEELLQCMARQQKSTHCKLYLETFIL